MSEENAEVTVETTETVEELQERLRKAEAKIVDMKKSTTPAKEEAPKVETQGFDEDAFEKKYEEKKFFESNPDMVEYKEMLLEKVSKWNSWKEAKLLVENSDSTIAERKKTNSMDISWKPAVWGNKITQEQISKLPPMERAEIYKMQANGEIEVVV